MPLVLDAEEGKWAEKGRREESPPDVAAQSSIIEFRWALFVTGEKFTWFVGNKEVRQFCFVSSSPSLFPPPPPSRFTSPFFFFFFTTAPSPAASPAP